MRSCAGYVFAFMVLGMGLALDLDRLAADPTLGDITNKYVLDTKTGIVNFTCVSPCKCAMRFLAVTGGGFSLDSMALTHFKLTAGHFIYTGSGVLTPQRCRGCYSATLKLTSNSNNVTTVRGNALSINEGESFSFTLNQGAACRETAFKFSATRQEQS